MSHDLTNLLPKDKTRAFRRDYFFRLGTTGIIFAAIIIVAHGLLLFPSYLFLSQQVSERQGQLTSLSSSLGATEETQISNRIAAMTQETSRLTQLSSAPSASKAVRAILAVSRQGIALTGVTFSPPKQKDDGRMVLTGNAKTREALQNFQTALTNLSFVTTADLPISSFAKESDIPFSITLTGTLTP